MKTIGIIGGFGPEATAQFYLKLVSATRRVNHGTQPHILLRNVSVPSRLEHDLLVKGKSLEKFIPHLTVAARQLEKAGADGIVLPCNTLHIHENIIRKSTSIQFISIITSTVDFLQRKNISRIGFLGSGVTIRENLFKKRAKNITFITVDAKTQRQIDEGLNSFVENQDPSRLTAALEKSFSLFKQKKVRDILLACTDFGSICPANSNIRVHDTLDILVEATVNML